MYLYSNIIHSLQQQCVMVRLTITPAILRALQELQDRGQVPQIQDEASLDQPAIGNPITHGQILAISKILKEIRMNTIDDNVDDLVSYHLDDLLRGSRVYVEPPKPKAEPVGLIYLLLPHAVALNPNRLQSTKR